MQSVSNPESSQQDPLLQQLMPRIESGNEEQVLNALNALRAAHPNASDEYLYARLVVRAAEYLNSAARYDLNPPTTSALSSAEHRLLIGRELAQAAPPELADGPPLKWATQPLKQSDVIEWWQQLLERRQEGLAPSRVQLYTHIPFCRTLCGFCQYSSVQTQKHAEVDLFVEAFVLEARAFAQTLGRIPMDAVTIGGGTPSYLSAQQLDRVLEVMTTEVAELSPDTSFSVEFNPDSTTADKVRSLAEAGVTRLSLGVQSLSPAVLRAVQRGYQTTDMVEEAVRLVRKHPSIKLSLDLLTPLPKESADSFLQGAIRTLELEPDQLVLFDYQPARKRRKLLPPGSLAFKTAAQMLIEEGTARGYDVVANTGPSVILQRPGYATPRVQYMQHPREPTSTLGLGAFAESYLFGVGRYLHQGDLCNEHPYQGEAVTLKSEAAQYVSRQFALGLPLDRTLYRRSFGHELEHAHDAAVGYLEEQKELVRDAKLFHLNFPDRAAALHAAWLFYTPESIELIRTHSTQKTAVFTDPKAAARWLNCQRSINTAALEKHPSVCLPLHRPRPEIRCSEGRYSRLCLSGGIPLDTALSSASANDVFSALMTRCAPSSVSETVPPALRALAQLLINANLGSAELTTGVTQSGRTNMEIRATVLDCPPDALRYLAANCGTDIERVQDTVWYGVHQIRLTINEAGTVGLELAWNDPELVLPLIDKLPQHIATELKALSGYEESTFYRLDMRRGTGTLCLTGLQQKATAELAKSTLGAQALPTNWDTISTPSIQLIPAALELSVSRDFVPISPAVIVLLATASGIKK